MSIRSWMRSPRSGTMSSVSSVSVSFSGTAISRPSLSSFLPLDGDAHQGPPLRPAAIIVPHLLVAQQVGEDEPGVAAALADAAVDDDVVVRLDLRLVLVEAAQLFGGLEGAVFGVHRLGPGDARRS